MDDAVSRDALIDILRRLRDAQRASPPSYVQRMDDLARLRAAFVARRDAMVDAVGADFGHRSRHETLAADAMTVLDEIDHVRRHLRAWMRPRHRGVNGLFLPARAELRWQPRGVVGVISPWNYPVNLALVPLIGAVAAGNHVMLKPSEHVPRTAQFLRTLLADVFPADRVAVVTGDADVAAAFAALPFDHLFFTGSTAVGRKVMTAAAANLTPLTLELGGKSPALVAPGYPVAHAAARIVAGKCFNGGQTCIAPDYALVPRAALGDFVEAVEREWRARYPTIAGNPDYTSIIDARQAQRLRGLVDAARGAGLDVREHRPDGDADLGNVVPPTLVIDPPADHPLMRDEIFGPVLPVLPYDEHDAALDFIRDRDRPLAFYPFDRDATRLEKTLRAVVAGGVTVNDTLIHFPQHGLPFGGVGASGLGSYHGQASFRTFSHALPVLRQSRVNGMALLDPPFRRLADWLLDRVAR